MKLVDKVEKRSEFAMYDRYYYDKIETQQDIYELINSLIVNGYEPTGFQIGYDNDHASYDEPKKYEDYGSFIADLPNEFLAVDTVTMFYNYGDCEGYATIYLSNNSVLLSVPVKKNEESMSR